VIPIAEAKPLPEAFYNRDPRRVARALLGKLVIRKTSRRILAGRIVETEAYLGTGDAAAHSASGKTARNAVLFGPPGFAYVYFIYGNYYCLNVSCLPDGIAGGVLFRALEPLLGVKEMASARGLEISAPDDLKNVNWLRKISSGPGRLCEALDVTRERDNGKNLMSARSDLQIVDDGYRVRRVLVGPRIGITKSAAEQLRYVIAGNPFPSVPMSAPTSAPRSVPPSSPKSAPVKA
jgi:DNA-3-methyladenine glycosylase